MEWLYLEHLRTEHVMIASRGRTKERGAVCKVDRLARTPEELTRPLRNLGDLK